jgi:putative peptide zinc metalloprotease protein
MNLAEVLNVALPELPARRSKGYPRLHPKLIAREQIEGGVPTVIAAISGGTGFFRFTPGVWKIVELFNGERSYRQVSELYAQQSGIVYSAKLSCANLPSGLDEGGLLVQDMAWN